MFCPFLENREEEKMINKLVAKIKETKAPIVVGTGPDVKLHSGARTEKSIC